MTARPDPAREAEIRRHFEAAADLPSERRAEYLRNECPEALRPDVKHLVELSSEEDDYLDDLALRALGGVRDSLRATAMPAASDEGLSARVAEALGAEYEALEEVGHGGMGVVYRARHAPLDRWVAIKVLAPALREDPEARMRFELEARAAAGLAHPSVVPIYTVDALSDGLPFITMRFVPGGSLRDWLERAGPLPPAHALRLVRQVGSALDAAHRRGIVHRDVKPGNILLDTPDSAASGDGAAAMGAPSPGRPERVLLTDFGIAKAAGSGDTALTVAGGLVGSPRYMSPEQVAGDDLDARSDLYSLGVVAYELIAGRPPFEETVMHRMIVCHLTEAPPSLTERVEGCDPEVAAIVHRCLEKEPVRRFASAAELVAAIDALDRPTGASAAHRPSVRVDEALVRGRRVLGGTALVATGSLAVDAALLGGYTVSPLVLVACVTLAAETARRLWVEGYTLRQVVSSRSMVPRSAVTAAPLAERHASAVRSARAERALLLRTFQRLPRSEQSGLPQLRPVADGALRRVAKAARELDVLDRAMDDEVAPPSLGIVGERRRGEMDEARRRLEGDVDGGLDRLRRLRESVERYAARGGAEGLEPVLRALEEVAPDPELSVSGPGD